MKFDAIVFLLGTTQALKMRMRTGPFRNYEGPGRNTSSLAQSYSDSNNTDSYSYSDSYTDSYTDSYSDSYSGSYDDGFGSYYGSYSYDQPSSDVYSYESVYRSDWDGSISAYKGTENMKTGDGKSFGSWVSDKDGSWNTFSSENSGKWDGPEGTYYQSKSKGH